MTTPAPDSIEAALAEHAPFIERLARGLVGDRERAADLVQETWAAALRNPQAARDAGVRRWLSVVLRRASITERRREGRRPVQSLNDGMDPAAPDDSPEGIAVRLERQRLLQEALFDLPEPYRSTLVLQFQDGLREREEFSRTGGIFVRRCARDINTAWES